MNMNENLNEGCGNDGNNGNDEVGAQGGGNYKLEITGRKGEGVGEGKEAAVTVGDAAVTVVGDEVAINRGVESRRTGVRRSGVLKGRKRWGKIARMPLEVREWLNEQICDGVRYAEISA